MTYPPPPYADAVCGTPLCGEAICAMWWAYPLSAALNFAASSPTYTFSSTILPDIAKLLLDGIDAKWAAQQWLFVEHCTDVELDELVCVDVALGATVAREIDLTSSTCR